MRCSMRRWILHGAILATVMAAGACRGSEGVDFREILTYNGTVLDCPTDEVNYSTFDRSVSAPGFSLPSEALSVLTPYLGLPLGTPQLESEGPQEVVYVYTDPDGHRLGRIVVVQPDTGWFVVKTERCNRDAFPDGT